MAWFYLIIASIFEVSWAVGLKYSEGLSKPVPTIFTVIAMLLSFVFLSQASKSLPIGTAYVIWTGIGAAGTAFYGMLYFGESREVVRILCLMLIISGVIGLKFTSNH
ncbi:MAG: DMT family transporter [Ignavibacteriales bacterium]